MIQDNEIAKYIKLPKLIADLEHRKDIIRKIKYNKSLYVHPEIEGGIITTVSVKPERFVIDLVSCEETLERMIQRCKMRLLAFNHKGLTYKAYKNLSLAEQEQIKDDCFQAETYTAYHFGYDPPTEELITENQDSLKDLAQLFSMEAWS